MADKEKKPLISFNCPGCGSPLVAEDNGKPIECVYCCRMVDPKMEAAASRVNNDLPTMGGTLKIEGIKTPSSALAYIEQFFEDYDWNSFVYAQSLSIYEADKLVDSLKMTSADDKNTWLVAFAATFVPYSKKVFCCEDIIADIIEKYKKDDLDAYSKFDAYKRVVALLISNKESVIENLQKIIDKAAKYGATSKEIADLKEGLEKIRNVSGLKSYATIEEIPSVKAHNDEKNLAIAKKLAAKGINADAEYARAKSLVEAQRFVEALDVLVSLEGYSDSEKLADKVDDYFLMNNVLQITGKRYFYKRSNPNESVSYTLYPTNKGEIAGKPVVKFIKKIITNYADLLYYIDTENILRRYSFSTDKNEKLFKTAVADSKLYVYKRKVYLRTKGEINGKLIELNLSTGAVEIVLESVSELISFTDNKLVYFGRPVIHNKMNPLPKEQINNVKRIVNVIDVDTKAITVIGKKGIQVEGFLNNFVVYTVKAPSQKNLNLFVKELGKFDSERLIEKNIFRFREIFGEKLIYDIGNSRNRTLVYANVDASGRKEWPLSIEELLFEQGGWIYFLRKSGRNAILCKAHIGDKKFSVIAKDVADFVDIKNGYFYYKNFDSELIKVRMDGSNVQKLCDDVEKVITIKEDKVVFVSVDERLRASEALPGERTISSIYMVDFTGSGKRKLVYRVKNVKEFDEKTVYYTAMKKSKDDDAGEYGAKVEKLYKLDINNGNTQLLLTLENNTEKEKKPISKYALIAALVLFLFGFIMILAEAPGFTAFSWVMAVLCVVIAILFRTKDGSKSTMDQLKEKMNDMAEEKNK